MRAGDTVFGALLLLWGPGALTLVSVCEGSPEGGFRPELVEVHNRSVLRCLNSCSQKVRERHACLVSPFYRPAAFRFSGGPQAGEWTSSPYKLAVSVVYLEDRKGPGLQINFSLAPDANLLYVNKTVIEISMADRRHCVTLQYTGSFTAQVNHRGEPVSSAGCQGPQAGEWTSSPYKLAVSVVYLEDRKGPGLQINFSLAPDANLLYVNKTVIEISMADRRHCMTLQYTGSFTAQVNHRGEPWSFSYIACMTVKPGQSLSISLYNMPYGYQPLTRTLQLPDCENPLMKEYAGELCPAILIHSRLSQGVLNVSYSSSLADPSYLVWLCVWNAHFCSSEDASPVAAPVEVAGRENSVIFHNVTALPCLCVRVISKMSGPHHEGQDCPFRAHFHLDVKVQPGPRSLLLQLSGFPRPCSLLLQALLLHTDRSSGLLINLTQPQNILVSGPHSQEFPLPPSLLYSWPVCIKHGALSSTQLFMFSAWGPELHTALHVHLSSSQLFMFSAWGPELLTTLHVLSMGA
ncbi:hypothetical protein EOD39_19191 [Acipenser ruthenus]|uniref:IL17RA/B N-terminal domain-containing protein n=1 Tax=Acipenser ruthenus TaxID=7906 RepID=A0A444UYT1_ACIRT|nr:hypothetical protein EOD39_19191 [Acipenser ruthenus]